MERQWWVNSKFAWGGLVGSLRERSADVPKNNKRGRAYAHASVGLTTS